MVTSIKEFTVHMNIQYSLQCQLPEDVVGKDANECCKCYRDRGVPNMLISFGEFDMIGGSTIKLRTNEGI